jgi:hypothetical protein
LIDATVDGESASLGSPSPAGPYTVTQSTPLTISHNINLVGLGARSSTIIRTGGFLAGFSVVSIAPSVTRATIQGVTITGGDSLESPGGGVNNQGVLTLRDSAITANTGESGGGGIFSNGTLAVIGSTISGNTAAGGAGARIAAGSNAVFVNSTISDNQAFAGGTGGGLFVSSSATVTLANVTLSSNEANSSAGGDLYNLGAVSARNTLIASGTGANGTQNCVGVITSEGYNIEDRDQCGLAGTGDQTNTDPMLGALQDNGGQTDTRAPALDSPVVDHGNPTGCTDATNVLLMVDQRGLMRPEGLACDVGAYELQPVPPAAGVAPATGIGPGGATLNGSVDTHGFQTTWQFEYGPTTAYGSATPIVGLAGGTRPVSTMITGLLPNTTYHFMLVASTSGGTTKTAGQTFTTGPNPSGSPSGGGSQAPGAGGGGARPPVLGPIAIVPSAFRVASSGASIATARRSGATVTYTDSQLSTTAFTVLQARPGISTRGRCTTPPKQRPHPRGRACTRYVHVGGFTHTDASGPNRFRFTGRVQGHKLPPGRYRLDATPTANGKTGNTVAARFGILR